jgi:hypothetical protein
VSTVTITLGQRRGRGTTADAPTRFHVKKPLLELAFALTYYKCQGQTLPRVILDLTKANYRTLSLSSLFVAMSRVRESRHMRRLPDPPTTTTARSSSSSSSSLPALVHLLKLEHDVDLIAWTRALKPTTDTADGSMVYRFDEAQLNAVHNSHK